MGNKAQVEELRILVAGGGIGGVTAALCLASKGFEVCVFEQAPEFDETGAGIQLSPNCTRVLHHLGLESALRASAFLPVGNEFRHWRNGQVIAHSPLGDEMIRRFGQPYYHIQRGDLLRLLVDAARRMPSIELHTDSRVQGFTQDANGVGLSLAEASQEGLVLVGADGIHSVVRRGLLGDERPRFTGNVAWRGLVPVDRLPEGLIRPVTSVWWGPKKHFVHYYLRGGDLVNCVCVVQKQGWEVESWTEPGSIEELKSDFAGWHKDIQALIDELDRDSLFKWALYDREPLPRWGNERVTLLGDACHPSLPFMAQGAAMAIEDAAVLAACLSTGDEVVGSLQRYEALRRERTAFVQRGSRRNARIFHLSGMSAWLRDLAAPKASQRVMDTLYGYDALKVVGG